MVAKWSLSSGAAAHNYWGVGLKMKECNLSLRFTSGTATSTMESVYNVPFLLLECPHLKLKKPSWVKQPSAMTMFALVLLSYFLVTGGK